MQHKSDSDLDLKPPGGDRNDTESGEIRNPVNAAAENGSFFMFAPLVQTFRDLWKKLNNNDADVPTNNNAHVPSQTRETGQSPQGSSQAGNMSSVAQQSSHNMAGYIPFKTPAYVQTNNIL